MSYNDHSAAGRIGGTYDASLVRGPAQPEHTAPRKLTGMSIHDLIVAANRMCAAVERSHELLMGSNAASMALEKDRSDGALNSMAAMADDAVSRLSNAEVLLDEFVSELVV